MNKLTKRFTRAVGVTAALLLAFGGASAVVGGAADAAVIPLSVSLSANDGGTAVFNASGAPVLTVGSPSGTAYAQMLVNLPSGTLAPAEAPTFTTTAYAAGSPRWVIELANGNLVAGYADSEDSVSADSWVARVDNAYSPTDMSYSAALAAADDSDGNVAVTSAFIVEDGDQAAGTADTLTNVQYDGQFLPGTVAMIRPYAQAWTVGTAATLQIGATTSASDTRLAYTATGLPAGLSINASTGLISGTPTTAQSYTTSVTATDDYGDSAMVTFSWVTSNPVTVTVPSVVGRRDLSTADGIISAAGLTPATAAGSGSPVGNLGSVTAQVPAAGTVVAPGTTVTLTYTVPKKTVPSVVGRRDLSTAEGLVKAAGFTPAVAADSSSPAGNKGDVTIQLPGGGTLAPVGSTVTLTYKIG
jgi:hypothetical protein